MVRLLERPSKPTGHMAGGRRHETIKETGVSNVVSYLGDAPVEAPGPGMSVEELLTTTLAAGLPLDQAAESGYGLARRFQSVSRTLSCDMAELRRDDGVSEAGALMLKTAEALHLRMLREYFEERSFTGGYDLLHCYCRQIFRVSRVSVFKTFFLRDDKLVKEGRTEYGTTDEIAVYAREIMKEAMMSDADAIFIAFGRKSGDEALTETETLISEKLERACDALKLRLAGKIVVLTGR